MLAEEYVLIDISVIGCIWCDWSPQRQLKSIQLQHFFLYSITGPGLAREYQHGRKP
jgi:hypothetical protein